MKYPVSYQYFPPFNSYLVACNKAMNQIHWQYHYSKITYAKLIQLHRRLINKADFFMRPL